MNRRGFIKIFGMAMPALALTSDYVLPVDILMGTTASKVGPPINLQNLTARVATMLAEELEGLRQFQNLSLRDGFTIGQKLLMETPQRFLRGRGLNLPSERTYETITLIDQQHLGFYLEDGHEQRVDDGYLRPAVSSLAAAMRANHCEVTAPSMMPKHCEAVMVQRAGVFVRGLSDYNVEGFGTRGPGLQFRFDVLYGGRA